MKPHYIAVFFAALSLPHLAVTQLSTANSPVAAATQQDAASQPPQPLKSDIALAWVKHPLKSNPPEYPKHALKNKVQGSVLLNVSVNRKGRVSEVSVLSGDPELAHAAIRAITSWKYAPLRDDARSEVTIPLKVDFDITDARFPQVTTRYADSAAGNFLTLNGGVKPPRVLDSPDPSYTKEARKAKIQGTCVLSVIVGSDGMLRDIHVVRSLNKGLDEKAIEAVQKWKFAPASKDGQAVAVMVNVEVQFRLY